MIRLLAHFRKRDWLFLAIIMGLTVLQVWCTMLLTDAMQELISSITYINYQNHPENLNSFLATYYQSMGSWEAVAASLDSLPIDAAVKEMVLRICNASQSDIWLAAGKMLGVAAASMLCQGVISYFAASISSSLATNIRKKMIRVVDTFSLNEINRFSTASLVTRSTNDINQLQMTYLFMMRVLFAAPTTAIWAICKINATSSELTWVTIIAVTILTVALISIMFVLIPKFRLTQKYVDRLNLATRENLSGIRVIRAYNAESYQEEKFDVANKDLRDLNLFTGRIMAIMSPAMMLLMNGVGLSMYWLGARLINAGTTDYATVSAYMMLSTQVIMSFLMLLFILINIPRAAVSAKRVNEVLDTKSSISSPENPKEAKEKGALEFDHVYFRYPDGEDYALHDISFQAKRGETIAILGATGSGKSTLIQLIDRLYDCSEGRILLDGVDIREQDLSKVRKKIGYVPQKGFLFRGTVESNLRFGDEGASQERLEEAARIACADSFINEMEQGYASPIAQGGTNVSGGQRQRLCIARALVGNPEFLLFDDSFSALDFKTDLTVRKNLKEHQGDTTRIIVAQRIGTIMDADQILLIDDGKVVAKGKHEELLHSSELYRSIALSQLSKEELGL